jgi:hypothetical protein
VQTWEAFERDRCIFSNPDADNRGMAHKAVVVSLSLLLLLLASAPAESCECSALKPLSNAIRTEAPFIFEGRVVEFVERSLHTTRTTSGGDSGEVQPLARQVVFEVRRVWNGVRKKRIAVASDLSSCMFSFEVDRTYVVFSWKDAKGELTTSHCSRTVESSQAADILAHLGQATVPR